MLNRQRVVRSVWPASLLVSAQIFAGRNAYLMGQKLKRVFWPGHLDAVFLREFGNFSRIEFRFTGHNPI